MNNKDKIKLKDILKSYWGYDQFRPLQEEVIQAVINKHDTLALFPTGGGKSICYQIPALAMEGVTIVISPLIALMRDQVSSLLKRGIKAATIYSGMHPDEIHRIYSNIRFGGTKLLYISPERLQSDSFRENLPLMKVNLLAIDEAHCISQWGHDFRPDYRKIADIRTFLPSVPVLALTATATPLVIEDITQKLQFKSSKIFKKSFVRENLIYVSLKESDKLGRIKKIIENIGGSGILYVRNRKKTVTYAKMLSKYTSTDYYHAGLPMNVRNMKQQNWMEGKTKLIICTNAFGMGIDKSNVRYIIHTDIPSDIESYFQEAGRGGRDGKISYSTILYDDKDIDESKKNHQNAYPPLSFIKTVYDALGNHFQMAIGSIIDQPLSFNIVDFVNKYDFNIIWVYNALKFLEKESYILLNEGIKQPSKLHINVSKKTLYQYELDHKKEGEIIKVLLRSYSGLFNGYNVIHEKEIAKRTNYSVKEIIEILNKLEKNNIINYQPSHKKPQIIYIQPRLSKEQIRITPENYLQRKEKAEKRLLSVHQYIENKVTCRSQLLVNYFGEETNYKCGKCDNCLNMHNSRRNDESFKLLQREILNLLTKKSASLEELAQYKGYNKQQLLIKVIQYLLDNEQIIKNGNRYYLKRNL